MVRCQRFNCVVSNCWSLQLWFLFDSFATPLPTTPLNPMGLLYTRPRIASCYKRRVISSIYLAYLLIVCLIFLGLNRFLDIIINSEFHNDTISFQEYCWAAVTKLLLLS